MLSDFVGTPVDVRIEKDLLGEAEIPKQALYGIQTWRATQNFNLTGVPLNHFPKFVRALAMVKLAAAKANAKKALDWRDEYGRDEVTAGTPVGWQRANQLAKGEKLSRDVISRMAQFNRHRKNSEIDPELKSTPWKDNGYVAWLIWGGDEGVDWAINKIKEIDEKG